MFYQFRYLFPSPLWHLSGVLGLRVRKHLRWCLLWTTPTPYLFRSLFPRLHLFLFLLLFRTSAFCLLQLSRKRCVQKELNASQLLFVILLELLVAVRHPLPSLTWKAFPKFTVISRTFFPREALILSLRIESTI